MATRRSAETKKPALSENHAKFVEQYLVDLNATQAAIRAGYSARSAAVHACRLLTNANVQAAIAKGRKQQQKETGITAERVIREAARLAFFDIRKLCDKDGNPIPIHLLDDDTAAAIQGLELSTQRDQETESLATVLKYKVADKNSALERLFKHLGLFEKDNKQNNPASAMAKLLELVDGSKLPVATKR